MVYFSLAQNIYATKFENAVIILNAASDQYISLIDDAADALKDIVSMPFTKHKDGTYLPEKANLNQEALKSLNEWITEFSKQGLITLTNQPATKRVNPSALVPGGLREYQWDTKKDWQTVQKTSYLSIAKALITLIRVNRAIKKGGMKGLFDLIAKTKNIKNKIDSSEKNLEPVIAAVDTATKLYPKKTYCLGWAATFVIEARKRGIDCNLLIGIQANPFYAHAWAELADSTVVHDDPQVAQVLSIIAKLPEDTK